MVASKSAETAANPSHLPPRFEIRQLTTRDHVLWASAIVTHSNAFHSPLWSALVPDRRRASAMELFDSCDYLMAHQVASGMSFGVFDTQYAYKRPESVATEGRLYWDENRADVDADGAALLDEMDFPLVSVAMSYDAIDPLDMAKMGPLLAALPQFGPIYHILHELDPREPASWEARARGEVLLRASTCTRPDYMGHGLMKMQAQWLMREAAARGYRGIQIETMHDAVRNVWANPPAPFKAEVVSSFRTDEWEETAEDGEKSYPFRPAAQETAKIYVTLK